MAGRLKTVEPAQPPVPAHEELAEAEKRIFGKDALRNPDGVPMERGHGSNFQKMPHADRSHYLTVAATASADEAGTLCATLSAIIARLMESQSAARAAAEKAVTDAAVAQVNASAAAEEIRALTQTVERLKSENLKLTAELAKAKEA